MKQLKLFGEENPATGNAAEGSSKPSDAQPTNICKTPAQIDLEGFRKVIEGLNQAHRENPNLEVPY